VAVSLGIPMAFVFGAGVVPMLIGIIADKGYFSWGIRISGGLIMTGFLVSFFFKPKLSDRRTS